MSPVLTIRPSIPDQRNSSPICANSSKKNRNRAHPRRVRTPIVAAAMAPLPTPSPLQCRTCALEHRPSAPIPTRPDVQTKPMPTTLQPSIPILTAEPKPHTLHSHNIPVICPQTTNKVTGHHLTLGVQLHPCPSIQEAMGLNYTKWATGMQDKRVLPL
jgi:hypothetical protein